MNTTLKLTIATIFTLLAVTFALFDQIVPEISIGMQIFCFTVSVSAAAMILVSIPAEEPQSKYKQAFAAPNWGHSHSNVYQDIEVQADRWEAEQKELKELKE